VFPWLTAVSKIAAHGFEQCFRGGQRRGKHHDISILNSTGYSEAVFIYHTEVNGLLQIDHIATITDHTAAGLLAFQGTRQ